nr:uncharacterized protein LOC107451816 isoform X3 [Parasteatoda tepidariorum]
MLECINFEKPIPQEQRLKELAKQTPDAIPKVPSLIPLPVYVSPSAKPKEIMNSEKPSSDLMSLNQPVLGGGFIQAVPYPQEVQPQAMAPNFVTEVPFSAAFPVVQQADTGDNFAVESISSKEKLSRKSKVGAAFKRMMCVCGFAKRLVSFKKYSECQLYTFVLSALNGPG